jgi:hypothetical protein
MKKSIFLVFLFISTLGFSQEQPIDVPMILAKVPLGKTVQFKNASVKFIKVLEDSRCPKDVTCVWAGQAKLLVEVTEKGKSTKEMELLFGGSSKNVLCSEEGYQLTGMSLSPYPVSDDNGVRDYVLLVSEEQK